MLSSLSPAPKQTLPRNNRNGGGKASGVPNWKLAGFSPNVVLLPVRAAKNGLPRFVSRTGRAGRGSLPAMSRHFGQNALGHVQGLPAVLTGNADARLATDGSDEVVLFFQQWIAVRDRQIF